MMTKYKIIKNPDEKFYEKITKAVEKNDFHCPCLIHKTDDTLCICKEFRETYPNVENGENEIFCHCRRFKKIIVNEE